MSLSPDWKHVNNNLLDLELDQSDKNRKTERRIKIRIPQQYTQEPLISRLISEYNIEVSIVAALLGSNKPNDGWFDLKLQGTSQDIDSALTYLTDLEVEIWYEENTLADGW
ncbi:ABC transporter [Aphanothece hegewaldii CCALA 016]|uniref:ABC transporter n=1 Tax=Aphanothece hegewaldii CCALA 016 TaxID=2107694 RepID=A0A2T1LU60_9CHRO|nr:NIL domain-containing protein [Aphanothece hegewaldii]PSF34992.1 ABC transporter [Aphanothece hegewaldii CCALA 016]